MLVGPGSSHGEFGLLSICRPLASGPIASSAMKQEGQDPIGNMVWYRRREAGFMLLDRDDRGGAQ